MFVPAKYILVHLTKQHKCSALDFELKITFVFLGINFVEEPTEIFSFVPVGVFIEIPINVAPHNKLAIDNNAIIRSK